MTEADPTQRRDEPIQGVDEVLQHVLDVATEFKDNATIDIADATEERGPLLEIRPHSPRAAPMLIHIARPNHYTIEIGHGLILEDIQGRSSDRAAFLGSLQQVMRAVAMGRVEETTWMRKGSVVRSKGVVVLDSGRQMRISHWSLPGLLPGAQKMHMDYGPYKKGLVMKAPHPPVFLIEGEDVGIFTSVQHAEDFIEPADVEVGEAFDGVGQRLNVTTDGVKTFIDLAEKNTSDLPHLERVLRQYLEAIGELGVGEQTCDFDCLVEVALRHAIR